MATSAIPSNVVSRVQGPVRRSLPAGTRADETATSRGPLERSVGEMHHASVLKHLVLQLGQHEREWRIRVLPRQNVQCGSRCRVADVAVAKRETGYEPTLVTPPLLVVEVLCDDDRMAGSHELISDYVDLGVKTVWVVDPKRRRAYAAEGGNPLTEQREDLTVSGTAIRVPVLELFAELDEMEFVIE